MDLVLPEMGMGLCHGIAPAPNTASPSAPMSAAGSVTTISWRSQSVCRGGRRIARVQRHGASRLVQRVPKRRLGEVRQLGGNASPAMR